MIEACHKCGTYGVKLIHHHKSYDPEIVVMMCKSCHQLLHNRLRRTGKCTISVDELCRRSMTSASLREVSKISTQRYKKKNVGVVTLGEDTMMPYVALAEMIRYNNKTGIPSVCVGFRSYHDKHLWYEHI